MKNKHTKENRYQSYLDRIIARRKEHHEKVEQLLKWAKEISKKTGVEINI